jgi:hypothetical protein
MAGGGTIEIPPGTYLLADCQIPNTVDVTLKPLGPVTIKFPNTASNGALYASYITEGVHVSPEVTITAIEQITVDYPVANGPPRAKLTAASGTFNSYKNGDIVFLQSDLTYVAGSAALSRIKAEWAVVYAVADSGATLYLMNPLNYDYTGFTIATLRRSLIQPKLTILPGITLTASVDPTSVGTTRSDGLVLTMPIQPDISINATNYYRIGVRVNGAFRGEFRCKFWNTMVKYSDNAWGYGLSFYGPTHQTKLWLHGENIGHVETLNGNNVNTHSSSQWYLRGIPIEVEIVELVGINCKRTVFDSHYSHRTLVRSLRVINSDISSYETVINSFCMGGTAVDPVIEDVYARNVKGLVYLSSDRGFKSTYRFGRVDIQHIGGNQASAHLVGYESSPPASAVTTVVIDNLTATMPASNDTDFFELSWSNAPDILVNNATFFGGRALLVAGANSPGPCRFEIRNAVWYCDANSYRAPVYLSGPGFGSDCTLILENLRIVPYNDIQNGVFRVASTAAGCKTYVKNVVLEHPTNVLAKYSSDSNPSGSVDNLVTQQYSTVQGRSAAPTTGRWSVGDIVYNSTPTAGGNIGWVCVTAGSPGTWKAFGTIAS